MVSLDRLNKYYSRPTVTPSAVTKLLQKIYSYNNTNSSIYSWKTSNVKTTHKQGQRYNCQQAISDMGYLFDLFGVSRRFQHCTGHITTGSWKGRGDQYIKFARVLYCKLPTNGKQLPAFPLEAMTGIERRPQR